MCQCRLRIPLMTMHAAGKQKQCEAVKSLLSSVQCKRWEHTARSRRTSVPSPSGCVCQSIFFLSERVFVLLSFIFFEGESNRKSEPIWIKTNDAQREESFLLFCLFLPSPPTVVFPSQSLLYIFRPFFLLPILCCSVSCVLCSLLEQSNPVS